MPSYYNVVTFLSSIFGIGEIIFRLSCDQWFNSLTNTCTQQQIYQSPVRIEEIFHTQET